jgi:spore coat protein U-like protein
MISVSLRVALTALLAAFALWLLVSPDRAEANVGCSATPGALNFGSTQTATGTVNYTCTNYDTFVRNMTLCLGVGTSSYPGTPTQPAMQFNGVALNYNLYKDAAFSQVWNVTSPFTRAVSIPANRAITGTFTYYARIVPGQTVPVGTYTGQLFNVRFGFVSGTSCLANLGDLAGMEFTINISASSAPSCTLGARNAIDFGTQSGLFTRAHAAGSVQLTCPVSRAWTLSFDGGRYAASGVRRMRSAAGYYVPYTLYRDANRTNAIAVSGTVRGTGTGAVQTTPIYGLVDPATPPPVGQYQDFIVVTLSF